MVFEACWSDAGMMIEEGGRGGIYRQDLKENEAENGVGCRTAEGS